MNLSKLIHLLKTVFKLENSLEGVQNKIQEVYEIG